MKNKVAYIFSWLLLAVFLLATSGIKIYSHSCNSGKKVEYSILGKPESCCPAEKVETTCCASRQLIIPEKKKCCSDSEFASRLDTDHFLPLNEFQLKLTFSVVPFLLSMVVLPVADNSTITFQTEPPPLPGRDILLAKRVLII